MIDRWIPPHRAEISPGFGVGRVLPFKGGKGVGPFVFLDQMGPHVFPAGSGVDVPPHPHIGLSTVTYLLQGELEHRDSLGTVMTIRPGDVNWMTAGRGIVHSERSPQAERSRSRPIHGLQAWVALPAEFEEVQPSFEHCESDRMPVKAADGMSLKLVAGDAFGLHSPVRAFSRLFYVHVKMQADRELDFDPEGQEAAFFVVDGTIVAEGQEFTGPGLLLFTRGSRVRLRARTRVEGMLLGGDPLPEHRRIWWNFVSSRPERIEEAKRQWKAQEFARVPGETTFVPLPE